MVLLFKCPEVASQLTGIWMGEYFIHYLNGGFNNGQFKDLTAFDYSNTKLVCNSDPTVVHFLNFSKPKSLLITLNRSVMHNPINY